MIEETNGKNDKIRKPWVIVIGAANGIGKATALKFSKEGAKVALLDLKQEKVDEVAATIRSNGGTALPMAVDTGKSPAVKAAISNILATFGQIDILNNCAGIASQFLSNFQRQVRNGLFQRNIGRGLGGSHHIFSFRRNIIYHQSRLPYRWRSHARTKRRLKEKAKSFFITPPRSHICTQLL